MRKASIKILSDGSEEHSAEDRQMLLLAEMQHRVKNLLAVVRSLAQRTLENSTNLEDFAAHFDGRLQALGRTQGILARNGVAELDLEELVRDELLPYVSQGDDQVEISGPPTRLRAKTAEIFALALHELATNAVKYGALSSDKGRLRVNWRVLNANGGKRLALEWRETGVPALNYSPERVGFGRDLIERGLPYELGARTSLEFSPGGVRCMIEFPLGGTGRQNQHG